MSDAVEKVRVRLLRASACLEAAGIPYAVVGGNAVAAWVSRVDEAAVRNTRDVDILMRREDLASAIESMQAAGFVHRRIASLGQAGHMDVFLDGPDAKARDAVRVVFASEKVREDALEESPDPVESELAGSFRLIALDALVRMKLTAWRDKDRMHLRDLVDVGLVGPQLLSGLPPELAERLRYIFDQPDG